LKISSSTARAITYLLQHSRCSPWGGLAEGVTHLFVVGERRIALR